MASSDSQIDKPQRRRPKRAELPDVNINTSAQSINTESLFRSQCNTKDQEQNQAKFHSDIPEEQGQQNKELPQHVECTDR